MARITAFKAWADPGFMEGGVEVPTLEDCGFETKLPTPDYTMPESQFPVRPPKGRFFSELVIQGDYEVFHCYNYLMITVTYDNASSSVASFDYFGWIDKVSILKDGEDFQQISVEWHVDLWRTYGKDAEFGYGIVRRRPRGSADPIQNVPCRYRLPGDYTPMSYTGPGSESNWVIINHTRDDTTGRLTEVRTLIIPVSKDSDSSRYFIEDESTVTCPSLGSIIKGTYDEALGISPKSITSVFISPIPPLEIESGNGTSKSPYKLKKYGGTEKIEYIDTNVSFTDKALSSITNDGRYAGSSYKVTFHYTDGSASTIVYITGQENDGIKTALMSPGLIEQTTITGAIIRPKYNGTPVSSMLVRPYTVDDFIRIARSSIGDDPVKGDTFTINSALVEYSTSPWSRTVSYTVESSQPYYNVNQTVPSSSSAQGRTFTYNGTTWGEGYLCVRTNDTVYGTYRQTRSSLSYQVAVDANGYAYTKNQNYHEYSLSLPSEILTTDAREYMMTDMSGNVIGTFPWGIPCKDYTLRLVVSSSSVAMQYRFNGIDSLAMGTSFTVPLPPVDLTSNSWSDYVYSGQREYDIEQRRIARDQALLSGVTGSVSSATQGAMIGGLKESQTFTPTTIPTMRSIGTMAGFGALGGLSGLSSSLIDYGVTGMINDRLQGASDMLASKQIDSIMLNGQGWDWLWNGRTCGIISMVADNYSLDRFNTSVSLSGIEVSEPTADCSDLITGTEGPLCITDLIVYGPIPPEAKQYIKQRFADGVRMKSRLSSSAGATNE